MLFFLYSYIQISVISSCQLCLLATGLHVYDESHPQRQLPPPPTTTSTGRVFFSHEFWDWEIVMQSPLHYFASFHFLFRWLFQRPIRQKENLEVSTASSELARGDEHVTSESCRCGDGRVQGKQVETSGQMGMRQNARPANQTSDQMIPYGQTI